MTRLQAVAADSGKGREPIARALVGVPAVAMLALICLMSISWTGWGFETEPGTQLLRDAPWVFLGGVTGAGAGALLAWVVVGKRGLVVTVGAGLGILPAAVMITAYFTDAY